MTSISTAAVMAEIRLYDSKFCRLCAENNVNGEVLFTDDSEETELSAMVNRYLPLKVQNDGKLPRTICPGCNIQLAATVQFFDLLVNGQKKIREMWKQQVDIERKNEREHLQQKNINLTLENPGLLSVDDENSRAESSDQPMIINIIRDGSVYAADHNLSLQMEGLDKPRRRRGRPPKGSLEEDLKTLEKEEDLETISQDEDKQEEEEEIDGDGRRRRKRKVPKRYMETVQGKELEKMFKEEGVFDEDEVQVKCEPMETINTLSLDSSNSETEIIGHLETIEGKNLGEFVVVNKNKVGPKLKIPKSKMTKKHKFICSYCGKGFLQLSKYIVHKSFHKTIKYECVECLRHFSSNENLMFHQETAGHTGEQIYEVNDIDEIKSDVDEYTNAHAINTANSSKNIAVAPPAIPSNNSFSNTIENDRLENVANEPQEEGNLEEETSHLEFQDSENTFRCDKCIRHFETQDKLEYHIKVGHLKEKPFICDICDKAFAYETSLKGHKEIVHQNDKADKGFPCDICGRVFNHPSSVTYHKITEHNNGRRFVCSKCGKSFKHKQLLQRHQVVHSEDRPHPCKSCNASFKTKANLLNHQSTHTGEKKHCCELCDHKFAHKTSLTLHYRTHTGQKPYKCSECQKSFSQNGNLQEHMRIHTGEKPYGCDHCGRKFTTSSQFKLHVKRHTGERPWKCEFCAKSFLHKDTWKCHVRRHTGERPFQCEYCQRGFTEQWALKKHMRLHTGEKPYNCEVCGKAFADCSNLTKHKKVHKVQLDSGEIPAEEEAGVNEVWQILPNLEEQNDNTLDNVPQILTDEASQDAMPIIYVAYQDPDHSNESEIIDKEESQIQEESHLNTSEDNENSANMEGYTITDEDGNTIPLSIAQQFLSQGHFVSQLNGGQTIRIQGLHTSLGENSENEPSLITPKGVNGSKTSIASLIQTDAEAIAKVLENEENGVRPVAAISQISTNEQIELADGQQTIEFITQDGQKVRLVTSLSVDSMHLGSQYLTII